MPRIALGTFALFATVAAGCAGSTPVAPTSVSAPQTATAPMPVPTAGPPTTTPSPAPTPAPDPSPAPAPSTMVYVATVTSVHWYSTPLFPSPTFTVTRYADHIHFDGTGVDLKIVAQPAPLTGDFSAGDPKAAGLFSTMNGKMWTFSGGAGMASGSLAAK